MQNDKRGLEQMKIELAMLDFRPGAKRALPATAQIDEIDRAFLFQNARSISSISNFVAASIISRQNQSKRGKPVTSFFLWDDDL